MADSPYYKLMIGRMLGYREENIRHHIVVRAGPGLPGSCVCQQASKRAGTPICGPLRVGLSVWANKPEGPAELRPFALPGSHTPWPCLDPTPLGLAWVPHPPLFGSAAWHVPWRCTRIVGRLADTSLS